MLLAAVVIVFAISSWSSNPSDSGKGQPGTDEVGQGQGDNVTKPIASEFYPWRDSYAQWLMAVFSIVATGVSMWAVGLVKGTLDETRLARDASERAIGEAQEANNISRAMAMLQLRAYLTVSECQHQALPDGYLLSVVIRNSGQTPAFGVRHQSESFASDYPNGGDRPTPDVGDTHSSITGPGESITCSRRLYVDNMNRTIDDLTNSRVGLWIHGKVVYTDCFGDNHWLTFRYVLRGQSSGTHLLFQMHADKTGNDTDRY
ncbi:MAG: hypothetical protein KDK75_05175 [Alphaproteobacteria bacterium]|nr:hypothetical protein [Alphaproteobacteria bacterium]